MGRLVDQGEKVQAAKEKCSAEKEAKQAAEQAAEQAAREKVEGIKASRQRNAVRRGKRSKLLRSKPLERDALQRRKQIKFPSKLPERDALRRRKQSKLKERETLQIREQ